MRSSTALEVEQELVEEWAAFDSAHLGWLKKLAAWDRDESWRDGGYASLEDFLGRRMRISYFRAASETALARRLYGEEANALPAVAAAVESGAVTLEQAEEIADSTKHMEPSLLSEIESDMVELAKRVEPGQIGKAAEKLKAQQLRERKMSDSAASREEQARRRTAEHESRYLKLTKLGHMTKLEGLLPNVEAGIVAATLAPLASPRSATARPHKGTDTRTYPQRLADAIVLLARRVQGSDHESFIPGALANLQTVVTLEELIEKTGIDPRITCDADVSVTLVKTPHSGLDSLRLEKALAAVAPALGGNGFEILEQGRTKRLATAAQRRALKVKYNGCAVDGCSMPFEFTEIHHLTEWMNGGRTNVEEMAPMCSKDHHRAHEPGCRLEKLPNGRFRIVRDT